MSEKIKSAINGICEDSLGIFKVDKVDGGLYNISYQIKKPTISDMFEFYKELNMKVKGINEYYNAFWSVYSPNDVRVELFSRGEWGSRELRAVISHKGKDDQSVSLPKYNPENENDVKLANIIFGSLFPSQKFG